MNEMNMEYLESHLSYEDFYYTFATETYKKGVGIQSAPLNYSKILSRLIKEAGTLCDHYASDLFIDWEEVERKLASWDFAQGKGEKFLFGFRDCGVDHAAFVFPRLSRGYEYKSLWLLDVKVSDHVYSYDGNELSCEVSMELSKVEL